MNVITSQHTTINEIVDEKKAEMTADAIVTLPVWAVGIDDLYVLADGHHRYHAAVELGAAIDFEIVDHPEGLSGEGLLEASFDEGEYIYIDTEKPVW